MHPLGGPDAGDQSLQLRLVAEVGGGARTPDLGIISEIRNLNGPRHSSEIDGCL
jgi:hypothetical protein